MNTSPGQPLPLPVSALPDGCPSWDGERARRWIDALPPRWVPRPTRGLGLLAAGLVTGVLTWPGDWPGWLAALVGLHLLWSVTSPEIVRVVAPVSAVAVLLWPPASSWPQAVAGVLALAVLWTAALLRLAARARQRERAADVSGGATAPVPDAGPAVVRGRFQAGCGGFFVAVAVGVVLLAVPRGFAAALCWLVAGLAGTLLVSGLLGRRRAAALRGGPAPVLRVLVRESADVDTEVFAADDTGALRPLFTVAVTELDPKDDEDEDEDEEELLARLERKGPGPLREAVLYGVPYDGAEIVLVSAAEEPGEPPLLERSAGPVRTLSDGTLRRLLAREKRAAARKAAREAAYEERRQAVRAAVARETPAEAPQGVRRWRAGLLDWLTGLLLMLWGYYVVFGASGAWDSLLGAAVWIAGILRLPRWFAWRITADSEGLWFNGLRGTRHIAWDDLKKVECGGTDLTLGSRQSSFTEWSAHAPRWPWFERRFGLLHPYERTAAEITVLWREPGLRPTVRAEERRRGRPLWPLAVVLGVAWTAALVFLP